MTACTLFSLKDINAKISLNVTSSAKEQAE